MKNKLIRKLIFAVTFLLVSNLYINSFIPTTKADVNIHTTKIYAEMNVGEQLNLGYGNDLIDTKWTSSKKSVALVSNNGLVTAKKSGKTTIIAKVNNESYSFDIIVSENSITPAVTISPTPTTLPTLSPTPLPTLSPTPSPTPYPTPTLAPVPTPIIQNSQDDISITVYITKTGSKYHRSGCRYLSRSSIPISLSEAKKYYSPCSICDPPQ